MKLLYQALGCLFLALGIVGIFVPGMPTTVFILLASWAWARGSKRFHDWLLAHARFGPMVRNWQERRAMPKQAKVLAISMMTCSSVFLFFVIPPDHIWVAWLMGAVCALTAIWMLRLPNA